MKIVDQQKVNAFVEDVLEIVMTKNYDVKLAQSIKYIAAQLDPFDLVSALRIVQLKMQEQENAERYSLVG